MFDYVNITLSKFKAYTTAKVLTYIAIALNWIVERGYKGLLY